MNLIDMVILNSTVTGASHIEAHKECQDYSLSYRDPSTHTDIIAVSDGHGGKEYSNSSVGAMVACTVAVESILEFIKLIPEGLHPSEDDLRILSRCICSRWIEEVEQILVPESDSIKSYGCTLIVYAQTPDYWMALQIGDGRCAVLNNGWSQPIEWDERCILNFTTSMCDIDACCEFRFASGKEKPLAVFLCSDGVDGTFGYGHNLYAFFDNIIKSVKEDGIKEVAAKMPEVLEHYSRIGSKDDMSLAFIIENCHDYS